MEMEKLYSCFLRSGGVCTDSRTLKPGQIFFALKGPNFNGNLFAKKALEMGATYTVTDEDMGLKPEQNFLVEDALKTFQELAHYHRMVWGKPVLGICGSNGKTTTKELTARVLQKIHPVFATPGNLNNHIGVPLSLLQLSEAHEFAVIELGANHPGEIAELCRIAHPNFGLITNIGKDHLEGFGTIENTAKANAELFDYLNLHYGLAFLNLDDEWNSKLEAGVKNKICFSSRSDKNELQIRLDKGFLQLATASGLQTGTQLTGWYNAENIKFAFAIGRHFGVPAADILEAIGSYLPQNNRSQWLETRRNQLILDAYNANPSSMLAALENLVMTPAEHKVAILGDMLELGSNSAAEHRLMGEWACQHPGIKFMAVGPEMKAFADACPAALYFSTKDELAEYLSKEPLNQSLILLKASRGLKLETLVEKL